MDGDDFDLFQWIMDLPNPFSGETGWEILQREAEGNCEPPLLDRPQF